ncbi:heme NO-binding domain-containing protein [Nostoc sp. MG11]|uniref:heme NO-binding domain-containing protein n=1 Tax=Nostoc sp. MG11 TaxID=2721166 RepID=UPI001D0291E1|nr:heme NO-binding domain-containing protein [Nostoc sp. MG11]
MYGLINKAIRDMVCDRFGEEIWQTIKQKAEVKIDTFLRMEPYPDDLTHKLVKATSEVVGLSGAEITALASVMRYNQLKYKSL